MQRSEIEQGATLRCVIADKNVRVCEGRMLMGHETYPLVIAKGEVV
jgi:glucose-1-phosphate adenylyltransferase